MPQPPRLLDFLRQMRRLHGLLRHHGNYRGSFEGALMEAQGLALIDTDGTPFDHRNSLEEFANGLRNRLADLDQILEEFRTRDTMASSLFTNAIGPFTGLCRRRLALAERTDEVADHIAVSPIERGRLAGCPARTRARGAGGTVEQWLESIRARTGWTPPNGTQILSALMMADAAAQVVLNGIAAVPETAAGAAEETRAAAELSRELVCRNEHHTASEEYSGYASALRRLWTNHGMLVA
jgi:hypothetical protein